MGCGGSTDKGSVSTNDNGQNNSPYERRPKISVRILPGVKKLEQTPRFIFIFGGPGSRKGRIVDDLLNAYGFQHVSTEDIIFQELPKKVSNVLKIENVKDLRELLETDPGHVTLEWVLEVMQRRIERDEDDGKEFTYLIDFIPNLKYMLKLEEVFSSVEALEKFEQKFPISFALNLAIPADKILKSKQVMCASPDKPGMKETGGQGDEADSGRIQKRAAMFEQCSKPFLSYFASTNRLVTVDVTCGVADFIWHRVHELLCDLDFHPNRTVNTVLLFAFEDNDCMNIDYDKYLMEKVDLCNKVDNPNDSVESLLTSLSQYVDNQSTKNDSFVICLSNTSLTIAAATKKGRKSIKFSDIGQGYLENYLPGSPKNFKPSPKSTKYKSVCSTENEICLFPLDTGDSACRFIASVMTETRLL